MVSRTTAIALGISSVAWLPQLPSLSLLSAALLLCLLTLWCGVRGTQLLLCIVIGLCYGSLFGYALLNQILPESLEGQDRVLRGQVEGLPDFSPHRGGTWRFNFKVEHCDAVACRVKRVRLSYRTDAVLRAGQSWTLQVRLKRPRSYANPGGFDYGRWLLSSGVHASGYVRGGTLVAEGTRLRATLVDYLRERLASLPRHSLLLALAVGDRGRLGEADWELLRASGLSHLVAISGLHVGIAAGLGLLLGRLLSLLWPALQLAPLFCGLFAAASYAWLAGFSLPTQRALIMVAAGLIAVSVGRGVNRWQVWALALLLVLMLQPLASLTAGFWLSFAAVAILLALFDREHGWRSLLRAQWALLFGLAPLSLALFGLFSPLSLPVNLLAVPIFSLFLIPLTLLALCLEGLSSDLAAPVWWLASAGIDGLMSAVEWLVDKVSVWEHSPARLSWLFLCAAALLLLAPRSVPARYLALVLLLPLIGSLSLRQNPDIPEGSFHLAALDVGQGLSVVVRTRDHALVYDVGSRYSPTFDLAKAAVLPYLAQQGVRRLDRLIISHNDNDHAGAYARLLKQFPGAGLMSGEALPGGRPCRAGYSWEWNRVQFRVLHPREQGGEGSSNNRSCVLLIQSGASSVLLPGDIDSSVEQRLLPALSQRVRDSLSVLLAPHHGSKTSSSLPFVRQLSPQWVIFSAGYKHHFGHPASEVAGRYRAVGSALLNTASEGAVQMTLSEQGVETVTSHRAQSRFYWR